MAKKSEYDQEIPQSQTADNPMAPQGRAPRPSRDTRKSFFPNAFIRGKSRKCSFSDIFELKYRVNHYNFYLSHDIASESDRTPCIKIDKPLVVYRFTGNVMTFIMTLRKISENLNVYTPKMQF